MTYEHVLAFALEHPWAVTPSMRQMIANILAGRLLGREVDPARLAALAARRQELPQPRKGGAVAVIPIYGVIAPRMNMFSEMSGGTTFEALSGQLREAMANDAVKTIIFDVDSPGGNVAGASEFAAEVRAARAVKPIIAQAQYLMASAAYWPMANATQVVAAPSAQVGSIGVYTMHDDISEALAKEGVKRELIAAGKFKAEGADGGPLSAEARAHIKGLIDANYGRMVKDIAAGRGVTEAAIRNGYGEGRTVSAQDALSLGMIDRVGTLSDTIARVTTTAPAAGAPRAHQPPSTQATDPAVAATSQEPTSDAHWQSVVEGALLELDI